MLFHTFEFGVFFVTFFILYWFIFQKNLKSQNILILIASYIFYGWWDWRFLSLLMISTGIDYFVSHKIEQAQDKKNRKLWMTISLIFNLGLLGFFKYYNFFVDSFVTSFATLGIELNARTLNIILPVGISFYTFQSLSYTIDVYRKKLKPSNSLISFAAFVSFFPQLVAGPIERASNLLPQIEKPRTFNYDQAKDGLRQMLWGFFKKIAIADVCGQYVDYIYLNYETLSTEYLVLGTVLFCFQIYGDFSGYSDIAIGSAKILGFRLMVNFNYPYFSRDIIEFWQRWHISMIKWFMDYLGPALGGSRGKLSRRFRNSILIFTISGFWHGANWTFVIAGFLQGVFIVISYLIRQRWKIRMTKVPAEGRLLPSFQELGAMLLTFTAVCLPSIFFRSKDINQAFDYIGNLYNNIGKETMSIGWDIPLLLLGLIAFEWGNRTKEYPLQFVKFNKPMRLLTYFVLVYLCVIYFDTNFSSFIYFQF